MSPLLGLWWRELNALSLVVIVIIIKDILFGAIFVLVVKTFFMEDESPVHSERKVAIFLNLGRQDAVPDHSSILE